MLDLASLVLATFVAAIIQYAVFNCLDCVQDNIPKYVKKKQKENDPKKQKKNDPKNQHHTEFCG